MRSGNTTFARQLNIPNLDFFSAGKRERNKHLCRQSIMTTPPIHNPPMPEDRGAKSLRHTRALLPLFDPNQSRHQATGGEMKYGS